MVDFSISWPNHELHHLVFLSTWLHLVQGWNSCLPDSAIICVTFPFPMLALGVCYSWPYYPTWEITEKEEAPVASFYLLRSLLALGAGSFTNTDIGVDYLLDSAIEVQIASLVSWLPAWEESTQLWLQKPMKHWSANWFLIVVGSSRRLFTWWLVKQNQRDSNCPTYFPGRLFFDAWSGQNMCVFGLYKCTYFYLFSQRPMYWVVEVL